MVGFCMKASSHGKAHHTAFVELTSPQLHLPIAPPFCVNGSYPLLVRTAANLCRVTIDQRGILCKKIAADRL